MGIKKWIQAVLVCFNFSDGGKFHEREGKFKCGARTGLVRGKSKNESSGTRAVYWESVDDDWCAGVFTSSPTKSSSSPPLSRLLLLFFFLHHCSALIRTYCKMAPVWVVEIRANSGTKQDANAVEWRMAVVGIGRCRRRCRPCNALPPRRWWRWEWEESAVKRGRTEQSRAGRSECTAWELHRGLSEEAEAKKVQK